MEERYKNGRYTFDDSFSNLVESGLAHALKEDLKFIKNTSYLERTSDLLDPVTLIPRIIGFVLKQELRPVHDYFSRLLQRL